MKRVLAVIALPLMALLMIGATTDQGRKRGQQDVYFGFLLGSERVAAVAIDLGAPDRNGQRVLRAYVCDGFGPPEGMAIWFTGTLTAPPTAAQPVTFTSVAGHERLVFHALNDRGVYGAFTDASGSVAQFVAYTAFDGAGIYQVTLDQSLHYTGISTDGAKLDAQASADGTTVGSIKPANGTAINFKVRSLALASPAVLAAHGLSPDYTKFVANNQVPGEYVAVIAPGGSHWFGRSGAVRAGSPGFDIIGLDKKEF